MEYSPILISLKTALVSIVITFTLGILLAFFVYRIKRRALRVILDIVLTLPLILPPTVLGFILLSILGVNHPVGRFFLEVFDVRLTFSWVATVIASVVVSLPLMYRTVLGAFEQLDCDLVYVARTLSFSEWKILYKVILPNAWGGVIAGSVLSFARGLGEFGATAMIAGNIADKTRTLPLAVYSNVVGGEYSQAKIYVLVLACISIFSLLLLNLSTRRTRRKYER